MGPGRKKQLAYFKEVTLARGKPASNLAQTSDRRRRSEECFQILSISVLVWFGLVIM